MVLFITTLLNGFLLWILLHHCTVFTFCFAYFGIILWFYAQNSLLVVVFRDHILVMGFKSGLNTCLAITLISILFSKTPVFFGGWDNIHWCWRLTLDSEIWSVSDRTQAGRWKAGVLPTALSFLFSPHSVTFLKSVSFHCFYDLLF